MATKADVILNAINSGASDEELEVLENTDESQFGLEDVVDESPNPGDRVENFIDPEEETDDEINKRKLKEYNNRRQKYINRIESVENYDPFEREVLINNGIKRILIQR